MIDSQDKPGGLFQSLIGLFPPRQFVRYLAVGIFNTAFGYGTYILCFMLFSTIISSHHPSLIAPLASLVSTPLNITVAYFGYKIFVFKTQGNYLAEWLKCFGVYGVGMLPGLLVLSALTRLLQALLQHHTHIAHPSSIAAYLAGALVQGFNVITSFFGHKRVTFSSKSTTS
jgi:putative flippase GtrA